MRSFFLFLPVLLLSGCDRISQRVWNCTAQPLEVLKEGDTGNQTVETIQSRSWIASMKGGVQITSITVADGARPKILWQRGSRLAASRSDAPGEVCSTATNGIAVQQF